MVPQDEMNDDDEVGMIKEFLDNSKAKNVKIEEEESKIENIDINKKLRERHEQYLKKKQMEDELIARQQIEKQKKLIEEEEKEN
jgi:hypothetical protein